MFNAILIEKDAAGYRAGLCRLDSASLPEGDVKVRVAYSSLNFKDGLAITGKSAVVQSNVHTLFPNQPKKSGGGSVILSREGSRRQ